MAEIEDNRIRTVVNRISMDEGVRQRILERSNTENKGTKNYRIGKAALVCAVALFWITAAAVLHGKIVGDNKGIVVYASTENEIRWKKLEWGKKTLLEPQWRSYVDYIFEIELQEDYLYDRNHVVLGNDSIFIEENKIYWTVSEEVGEYGLPSHMAGTIRIYLTDDKGKRKDVVLLELSKEDDKCYAELKYER